MFKPKQPHPDSISTRAISCDLPTPHSACPGEPCWCCSLCSNHASLGIPTGWCHTFREPQCSPHSHLLCMVTDILVVRHIYLIWGFLGHSEFKCFLCKFLSILGFLIWLVSRPQVHHPSVCPFASHLTNACFPTWVCLCPLIACLSVAWPVSWITPSPLVLDAIWTLQFWLGLSWLQFCLLE